jgi:hypothetical protein
MRKGITGGRKEYFHLRGTRRKFHVIASLAKHAMGGEDVRPRSRGARRPSFASVGRPLKARGRREDRVRAAPAVPCALLLGKNAHEHTGSAEATRPSLRGG